MICYAAIAQRDPSGRILPSPALERFASKCRFDAITGCVLWIGGTTSGQLKTAAYGSFWDGGRRWFAHRWAALHIHGLAIDGLTIDHCCPAGPNTLCVQHLQAVTLQRNLELQWGRRKYGWDEWNDEPEPGAVAFSDSVPFFIPPTWLRPFLSAAPQNCPF